MLAVVVVKDACQIMRINVTSLLTFFESFDVAHHAFVDWLVAYGLFGPSQRVDGLATQFGVGL